MEKHGLSKHPLHRAWRAMRERCRNKKTKRYADYGGKGITVCQDWDLSFMSFYNWAINEWKPGAHLSRININGNYNPENCRFTTMSINNCNRKLLFKSNTSGFRGVNYHKSHKKWRACIDVDGKRRELGHFESPISAAIRYDIEVYKIGDNERPVNFPKEG